MKRVDHKTLQIGDEVYLETYGTLSEQRVRITSLYNRTIGDYGFRFVPLSGGSQGVAGCNELEKGYVKVFQREEVVSTAGPIKSDGGSSTYYDIKLPDWVVALILERQAAGSAYVKTEELIIAAFDNDFDFGNAFKSLVRAKGAEDGAGKAGNGVEYEANKIIYSMGKVKQREARKHAD
ncbi:hypothetical protein D3C85_783500 [compost metagenome]